MILKLGYWKLDVAQRTGSGLSSLASRVLWLTLGVYGGAMVAIRLSTIVQQEDYSEGADDVELCNT